MAYTPIKTIRQLLEGILEAVQGVKVLSAVRGTLADLRVTLTGGTLASITTVTTVTTVTGVTTVTTLGNQTSVGGYLANPQVPALTNIVAVQSNINNILVA